MPTLRGVERMPRVDLAWITDPFIPSLYETSRRAHRIDS